MTSKFMAGHRQAKGNSQFDLYNEIADNFYSLIKFITDELPADMIVYVTMHEEKNDMGESKPKTIGKLLDDKVCVEGMFTIVLHAMKFDIVGIVNSVLTFLHEIIIIFTRAARRAHEHSSLTPIILARSKNQIDWLTVPRTHKVT